MRKNYRTNLNLANIDLGLLVFRIGIGALMLSHGIPKLLDFFSSEDLSFADPIGLGEPVTFGLAVFAEFVCAFFLVLGFLTRFAAVPLIITMGVAAFIVHADDPFSRQELPILFMLGFIFLAISGPGKYSLDFYLTSK